MAQGRFSLVARNALRLRAIPDVETFSAPLLDVNTTDKETEVPLKCRKNIQKLIQEYKLWYVALGVL